MKNKMLKIVAILVVTLMAMSACSMVFANNTAGATDFLDPSKVVATDSNTAQTANNLIGSILGVVQVIAMGVAVIMLIVLAIKYISAAPSEKADIKKGMITYVVGAILLFGATAILQVIKTFAGNI